MSKTDILIVIGLVAIAAANVIFQMSDRHVPEGTVAPAAASAVSASVSSLPLADEEWTLSVQYTLGEFYSETHISQTVRPFPDLQTCQGRIPELTETVAADGGRDVLALCLLQKPELFYVR